MPGLQPKDLVPIRWPNEPEWLRPESLSILEKSPVNCLLLGKLDATFAAAAEKRGVHVLTSAPATMIAEPVWPGVKRTGGGAGDAGPTGPPWVDANGWAIALARTKAADKPVWVPADPPGDRVLRPENFALTIADAEAYGGRWVVSLDEPTRKGLLTGDSQARETWDTIGKAFTYFAGQRPALSTAKPLARFGVMSDFLGENEFLGQEVLNLSARRHLAYRILLPSSSDLAGLAGLLWIDGKAPAAETLARLRAFVNGGGILVVPSSVASVTDGLASRGRHETEYRMYSLGKGQIAVAPEPWSDPYVVATDAHRIIGRRHDPFRLWNASASNAYPVVAGNRTIAQVINYTGRPIGHPMSIWVAVKAKTARFRDMFGRNEALTITPKNGGSEVSLPPFSCYAAIEFGEIA
jgi:hypothetical protein